MVRALIQRSSINGDGAATPTVQAHTAQDSPAPQGKARPWQAPPNLPWCPLSTQHWPGLGLQDCPVQQSNPWLSSPGMHCLGQGESRGQTPAGVEGAQSRGTLPHSAPAAEQPCSTQADPPHGDRAGRGSLPDHNAYVGKEGGKGEEEEYIPSRTVNHAE